MTTSPDLDRADPAPSGDRPPGPVVDPNRGPSTRPALIVLGLCFVLFIGAFLAQAAWSGSTGSSSGPSPTLLRTATGAPLPAVEAAGALAPITAGGNPPSDLLQALAVPAGTTVVAGSTRDNTVGTYDHTIGLELAASQQNVISFFHAQLPSQGWTLLSQGPPAAAVQAPAGSIEVLAKRASVDGNYWEVGVVVSPTTFGTSGSAATTGTTRFTLRLFVVADEQ
jgi:hypothetical protein